MKNYIEISTVVLFAIFVHSALTASLVNMFMTLHGVGGGGGGGVGGVGVEDDFGGGSHGGLGDDDDFGSSHDVNYGVVGNNNYDDLNHYLNAASRTTPFDDDDGSGKAYKWHDQRKIMQMGDTHQSLQQQQSLSKKRPSIIPTTTTTDNLSLEAYSAMLYKHRQSTSEVEEEEDHEIGGMVDKRGAKQSKLRLIQQNKFRYMR